MINKEGKALVVTIADVMTSDVVTIEPNTPIDKVISIFAEKNYSGLPVVSEDGSLAGIVTQYDLVTKGSGLHIPTLVKTLEDVRMIQPERMVLEGTLAPIKKLLAKDIMNSDPLCVLGSEPIEKAVESFAEHHKVNPLIVVSEKKKLLGVLSRHDLIKILAMKELGRVVGTAIERGNSARGAEEAVEGAIKGVRKEFLFIPKYGAGKWIGLGAAIFVIGLLASFLFIVRIPDRAKDEEVLMPAGEAHLYLRTDIKSSNVGSSIPVDIYVRFTGETDKINAIYGTISFSGPQKFSGVISSRPAEEFVSEVQLLNLKTKDITLVWGPSEETFTPVLEKEYFLGTLEFEGLGKGEAEVNFLSGVSDSGGGTAISDPLGQNILKDVAGVKFVIE